MADLRVLCDHLDGRTFTFGELKEELLVILSRNVLTLGEVTAADLFESMRTQGWISEDGTGFLSIAKPAQEQQLSCCFWGRFIKWRTANANTGPMIAGWSIPLFHGSDVEWTNIRLCPWCGVKIP